MAWAELNRQWKEDRSIRINLLHEQSERPRGCPSGRAGNTYLLRHKACLRSFQGELWSAGDNWCFQESHTGLSVTIPRESMTTETVDYFARRDRKLVAAMNAEYMKKRQHARRRMRVEASKGDQPKRPGDMGLKGVSQDGKKLYTWGDRERGQIEVAATPRKLREEVLECDSAYRQKLARETTPERALRKMLGKLQRIRKKAAKGEFERIVAKVAEKQTCYTAGAGTASARERPGEIVSQEQADQDHPGLHALKVSLNDEKSLEVAEAALVFLKSIRLHYCANCDEEWPVFDAPWPQTGVAWAGDKAGKCETIEGAGFMAAQKRQQLCSRCESSKVYGRMYCKENLQHLGPRHEALDKLTW